ncbi:MAG: 4-hydroxy-tetrahydrodipicolinate reductase [Bacteroidetes bacterium]|nr:4-hydroxy-tetrahydrodipicolinate reductase [Bacteroidota bacterium]
MNIALIGYGKMGKAIERLATQRGHTIAAVYDHDNFLIDQLIKNKPDIAIEFTTPEAAFANCYKLLEAKIPTLCGTTGWLQGINEIKDLCNKQQATFLHANNFSIGVNLFFKLNKMFAQLMRDHEQYNVSMCEVHHIHKKDAPSGTALQLVNDLIESLPNKSAWQLDQNTTGNPQEIIIEDIREGEVPGIHSIRYESDVDKMEITHTAKTRDAFAIGAVMVAEWLSHQQGFKTMNDFLG